MAAGGVGVEVLTGIMDSSSRPQRASTNSCLLFILTFVSSSRMDVLVAVMGGFGSGPLVLWPQ